MLYNGGDGEVGDGDGDDVERDMGQDTQGEEYGFGISQQEAHRPCQCRGHDTTFTAISTLGGMLLGLLLIGTSIASGVSHAAYATCRTDPTVTLSNGITSTMYADVQDTLTDIQRVSFQLHGPSNVIVTNVQYDASGAVESFSYVGDQKPNTFKLATTVTTASGKVKFTTYVNTVGPGKKCTTAQHAGSNSGKPVTFSFTCSSAWRYRHSRSHEYAYPVYRPEGSIELLA